MRADQLDYDLPNDLIAQHPPAERGSSRLLVVNRAQQTIQHRRFPDVRDYLRTPDLLVVNNTRVRPVRLHGRRAGTGGLVEIFLLEERGGDRYRAMTRSGGRLQAGERVLFAHDDHGEPGYVPNQPALGAELVERNQDGSWEVQLASPAGDVHGALGILAQMPLPPYIKRERFDDPHADQDRERYQTVYAREEGAVAAPTAGLHLTDALLAELEAEGITRAEVTLHVGPGTFAPVKAERLEDHPMHSERYEVTPDAAAQIARAKADGGRVVSVGTTSTRVLESCADASSGVLASGSGETDLMIAPGYQWRCVDVLLTNFHLPRSTLLALVFSFGGEELIRRAYAEAIGERYRFFSYGDAMLIV